MLSTVTTPSNEPHSVQHSEVLHDGLTAYGKVTGESRRRRLAPKGEPLEKIAPRGVGERREDFSDVAHDRLFCGVSRVANTYFSISVMTLFQPFE